MRIVLTQEERLEAEEIMARSDPGPPDWGGLPREKVVNLMMFVTQLDEHQANAAIEHAERIHSEDVHIDI